MREITMINGSVVLVDDADYPKLAQYKWKPNLAGYAFRNVKRGGKSKKLFLHHVVLPPVERMETDHINRNRLDNRRENLRNVPHWVNAHNRKTRPALSGMRGVSKPKGRNFWRAVIYINRKAIILGSSFLTVEDALNARRTAEIKYGV